MGAQTVHKVRAVVVDGKGRVAMIRGNADHVLQLPGGSVHPGETLAEAIHREVREETGCRIRIVRQAAPVRTRRSANLVEITTCFHVEVTEKGERTALTGRERRRGLHVVWFADARAARAELRKASRRYRRTAVTRDLTLTKAVARVSADPVRAVVKSARYLAACDGKTKTGADLLVVLWHMKSLTLACATLTGAGASEVERALKRTKKKAGRKAVIRSLRDAVTNLRTTAALIEKATDAFSRSYEQREKAA